jgi:hypothetical protein
MADLFLSAKQKVARARELIAALDAEIQAFNATEPHERMVETDPEGLVQEHTVKLTRPLPESLAGLTQEATIALRAALDQAVFAASKAVGSRRLMDTCFPIAEGAGQLDKVMEEKCKGVPPEIAAIIRDIKPFKGGNDLIWALAAIAAADKYTLIVPVGSVDSGLTFVNNKTAPRVRWDAKRREIELGSFPIHGKFQPHINIFFSAAFGEIETLENCPILPVLTAMTAEVEGILAVLETETCRLGLTTE